MRALVYWEPPKHGWVNVNIDDAVDQLTGRVKNLAPVRFPKFGQDQFTSGSRNPTGNRRTSRASIGIIIRDSSGKPELYAWKTVSDGLNAEEIEALACLEGTVLHQWTGCKAIIESDCATVIAATLKPGRNRSQLAFIMEELKHVSSLLLRLVTKL